jgi:transcriptional regulator with XRE-family HTH domain
LHDEESTAAARMTTIRPPGENNPHTPWSNVSFGKITMKPRHILRSLREARKGRSLTLARMSGLTGLNLSQISLIETGGVDPRLSSIEALAEALDLTIKLVPRDALPAVETLIAQASERAVGAVPAPMAAPAVPAAEPPALDRLRIADPLPS